MFRKGLILFGVVALCILSWFLFIKPYDYTIKFNIPKSNGLVYYELLDATQFNFDVINGSLSLINRGDLANKLSHRLDTDSHQFILDWHLTSLNDSLTEVKVGLKDQKNSILLRLKVLLGQSKLSQKLKQAFSVFDQQLEHRIDSYGVHYKGQTKTPKVDYCACIKVKTTEKNKARAMLSNIGVLNYFFLENELKHAKDPFLNMTSWDQESHQITFDFCFPMQESFTGNKSDKIYFKAFPSVPAVKSIFNGNYSASQRSWYDLLARGKKEGLKLAPLPIEIFYNNPQISNNYDEWRSDIYIPIKE